MKRRLIVVAVVVVIAALWMRHARRTSEKDRAYQTVRIERGDIVQTVRATGNVQPTRLVQVGTQVTGPVPKLYVDFNDRVKQGDLVAQIDPTVYEARLAQDDANVTQSRAKVEETQARLTQTEGTLARVRELMSRSMSSQEEVDAAVSARDSLAAQLKMAQANVEQALALQRLSRANLDYTTVRSPVDGVVISRNVNQGQTVVASLAAQVLFTIATDLRHMQVEASIPEADIGSIRVNQPVIFNVDAYDDVFTGVVSQVRLAPAVIQSVVTYPVIISVENPDGKLFPGMTANISCEVARQTNVLKVSNAAFRFKPPADVQRTRVPGKDVSHAGGSRIWIQRQPGEAPEPAPVTLGINDGAFTELTGAEGLEAGQEVVVGLAEKNAQTGTVNPFTPQLPGTGGTRR